MPTETVDLDAYGSVVGIEDLIGDVAQTARQFDDDDHPTEDLVIRQINFKAGETNLVLIRAGFTVSATTGLDATLHPELHKFVTDISNRGVAAQVLATLPRSSYVPAANSADEVPRDRRQQFFMDYRNGLKTIAVWGKFDPTKFAIGSDTDPETGLTKNPFFTRDVMAVPGAFDFEGPN